VTINTARQLSLTGRFLSKGHVVFGGWGNALLDMTGVMARVLHPGVGGRIRGYALKGDNFARIRITNSYFLQTAGMFTQQFQGYGASQNIQIDQNYFDEIDGRYSAGASGYVQSAWGPPRTARLEPPSAGSPPVRSTSTPSTPRGRTRTTCSTAACRATSPAPAPASAGWKTSSTSRAHRPPA